MRSIYTDAPAAFFVCAVINPIPSPEKPPIVRDALGRFPKGVSGCPQGPGKGYHKAPFKEMQEAVEEFKNEHGMSYWKAATIIAMKLAKRGNTTLLCKILDKFIPTKMEHTIEEVPEVLPFVIRGPNAN